MTRSLFVDSHPLRHVHLERDLPPGRKLPDGTPIKSTFRYYGELRMEY
jgi:hypothetical protein